MGYSDPGMFCSKRESSALSVDAAKHPHAILQRCTRVQVLADLLQQRRGAGG